MPGLNPSSIACSQGVQNHVQSATPISNAEFSVQFWGVRGSIPTPGLDTIRYGGNTACVEIKVAGKRLIFDAGTGLRVLGKQLLREMPVVAHLFFTHTHWDRIQGFPFFIPAFIEGNQFEIYGAVGQNGASIKQRLGDQMLRPNFPVPLQMMQAALTFHDIAPGSLINIDDVAIETIALHPSNSALGYRISWNGYSVVYATDTEYCPNQINQGLLYLAHEADLLIYDAAYTDHTYYDIRVANQQPATWQIGVEVALAAKVKQIVMFHHDPSHDDDFLDQVESEVQARFLNVKLAREGMQLSIARPSQEEPEQLQSHSSFE